MGGEDLWDISAGFGIVVDVDGGANAAGVEDESQGCSAGLGSGSKDFEVDPRPEERLGFTEPTVSETPDSPPPAAGK